jgi:predicted Zn-dependent peptidase
MNDTRVSKDKPMKRLCSRVFGAALLGALLCQCRPQQGAAGSGPGSNAAGAASPARHPAAKYENTAPMAERETPPPDGITPDWSFPKIHHSTLGNGLALRVVERHRLPLVDLRLVVLSGQATDGAKSGVAMLAGEMLKVGGTGQQTSRQLLDRVESLGSSLQVLTGRDATILSLAVTKQHLQTAIGILSDLVQKPRFLPDEYRKLKRREMDRTETAAHSDPGWAASMVLYRELFELPSSVHPYAAYDATSKEIEQVMLPDCKAWYAQHVTPQNSFLVVAGDVTPSEVGPLAAEAFGKWRGNKPAAPTFFRPLPPEKLKLFLVDRPGSTQAEIFVGTLGPERLSSEWAPINVANQVLGGGVAGRLFLDVREQRSLAYRSFSFVDQVAHGPSPVVLRAGTQTAKAGLALQALLEHVKKMGSETPTADEQRIATRFLSDVFLLKLETVGQLAQMTADLGVLGLSDDYYDAYRKEVAAMTAQRVQQSSTKVFDAQRVVIVVSGDAQILSKPLSHFAVVNVIDPKKDFAISRSVAQDAAAPIELERQQGM